jgi:hypothetical protein
MWGKCVSCGEGLFTGDAFCGNCGRPTTSAVPAAQEAAGGQSAPPDIAPEPIRPQPIAPQPIAPELIPPELIPPDLIVPRPDAAPELTPLALYAPDPARPEPARSEPARPEPFAPDPVPPELSRPEPARSEPARSELARPEPAGPAMAADEGAAPQLELGLGLAPAPRAPAPAAANGQLAQASQAGVGGQAGVTGQAGVARQADAAVEGAGLPEPELLVIPARQVGGPTGPGGRLTVPAQRRGQPGQPGQPNRQAGTSARVPARTRLTGQANLDPAANGRFLLRVARQAAVFAGIYLLTETVALIVFLSLGFTGLGLHAALRLEMESLWLAALAVAILFWIIPVPALLGQWTMLVENSADASGAAFENIAAAFRDHDIPLDLLDVRAVSPPHECTRDYLELRRGRFSGFISCFPHGRDLYVGWTFFLRMSPGRLMLWSIGRSVQHMTRRGGDIQRALWFESTRALVAAMHSAALAGVSAAVSAPDSAAETADSADDVVVKFG